MRGGRRTASGAEAGGAAHLEHIVHAGHARDVPSERLIESSCILPNETRRGGKWEARWILRGGWRQASGAEAGGAAHIEHPAHAGHTGDVPIKRLVETRCKLPKRMTCSGRGKCMRGVGGGRGGWRRASGPELGGAAHKKHPVHAGHARDVPIERLIESLCILPGEARRGGK